MVQGLGSTPVFNTMRAQSVTAQNRMAFRGEKSKTSSAPQMEQKDPTKVGYWRAAFSRLTDEQINAANESGKLNGKIKIKPRADMTGYRLVPNLMNITTGTQTIPEGYELRKNFLGFTVLLPKDSEGLLIKKK